MSLGIQNSPHSTSLANLPAIPTPDVCPTSEWIERHANWQPDKLQSKVLDTAKDRVLLCCTRQWGKSTVAAAKALHIAKTKPNALVLIAAAALRQSKEVLRKIRAFSGSEKLKGGQTTAEFENGSRIVALPGNPDTIRGFSAPDLIVIDEAAFVTEDLFEAITPMLATSNGALWLMSSANEQTGFFYNLWSKRDKDWHIVIATAADCPRISKQFLAKERAIKGEDQFQREFFCQFIAGRTQFIDRALIEQMYDDSVVELEF